MLKAEQVNICFEELAIEEMAKVSYELNQEDNIGARRLRTVVDTVLEDINYEAADIEKKDCTIAITKDYVF